VETLLAGPSPIGRSLPATSHLKFQHTGARMCDGMIGGGGNKIWANSKDN